MSLPRLSASKIKSYSSCSYLAYLKYNCGLPSKGNTGSKLGGITHIILECLAHPKRKEKVSQAIACGRPLSLSCLHRLASKWLKKEEVYSSENYEKINGFLVTGLENDFHGKGCEKYETEYEFNINNGKYWIYGFIDRLFIYEDHIRSLDFKSSKSKFSKGSEDMDFNIQALIYALVASKLYPGKKITVEFLFLKFRKNPYIKMEFSLSQIDAFEHYLEYISGYLQDFGLEKALANTAAGDFKRKWLCGKEPFTYKEDGSPVWVCEYKAPFLYFEAVKEGSPSKSAYFKKELDSYIPLGYTIVQRKHSGCPKFN